jgi:preprotein translocase subunit SecA
MAGRGVDVVLGGNYEGLATREAQGRGFAPDSEEFDAAYQSALANFRPICEAEGDVVRSLGGLYVLGSERHDSRRIDNQLRGRSGRQGDPGESRFYLSLQDDLLRLFATGAVSWVMDRTMPDDLPIEAKMVSKAIERAQNTVEGKNAEIRKDTLKYDEVMNEQRKVIYGRRQQVIDGEDIHDATIVLIEEILTNVVDDRLEGEFSEAWDLHQLVTELTNYYPTTLRADALVEYHDRDDILGLVIDEAVGQYEKKCAEFPGGMDTAQEIERDVMLQILDQRWRDHLSDMDYLRDGIHLRQIAQTDPLTAWQKEGYLMFEALLGNVDADYVRFITHVEASAVEAIEEAELDEGLEGAITNANIVAPGATELPAHGAAKKPLPKQGDKIGRNEPCWCGSGRKYKQCHGRP